MSDVKCHMLKNGFTVVELLVTVSIFVIISAVILFNYPTFSNRVVLNSLAHEVALAVREAQVFGTSVREFGAGTGVFPSHGVYFSTANNTSFVLFADADSDGFYDSVVEDVDTFAVSRGYSISQLCAYTSPTASCSAADALHITFVRPNPEAQIRDAGGALYSYASITVLSPRGDTRTVEVWSNGQITVQ